MNRGKEAWNWELIRTIQCKTHLNEQILRTGSICHFTFRRIRIRAIMERMFVFSFYSCIYVRMYRIWCLLLHISGCCQLQKRGRVKVDHNMEIMGNEKNYGTFEYRWMDTRGRNWHSFACVAFPYDALITMWWYCKCCCDCCCSSSCLIFHFSFFPSPYCHTPRARWCVCRYASGNVFRTGFFCSSWLTRPVDDDDSNPNCNSNSIRDTNSYAHRDKYNLYAWFSPILYVVR